MGASIRPTVSIDEANLSPADLWEAKVKGGMSADEATAYVSHLRGTPGQSSPNTPAPAAKRSTLYNAINTVDNALTFGLGQKFNAAFNAAGDAIRGRDSFAHSYSKNVDAEHVGLREFSAAHPYAAGALGALGTLPTVLASAPAVAVEKAAAPAVSMGTRMLEGARVGAGFGGVAAVGNAPNSGGFTENALRAGMGMGAGATLGAGAVPATEAIAWAARKAGSLTPRALIPRTVAQADEASSPMLGGATGPAAIAPTPSTTQGAPGGSVAWDARKLIERMGRAGITPTDALARLETVPANKPISVMELAGDRTQPIRDVGKWVARTQSTGAADLRASIAQRAEPLSSAQRVLGDVSEAMGVPRTNLTTNAEALKSRRAALAAPHYTAAEQSPAVPFDARVETDSPTLGDLLKRPSMRSAVKFHNEVAAERGEPLLQLPGDESAAAVPAERVPPGFSPEQWAQTKEAMKRQGVAIPQKFGGAATVRDPSGRLRSDLSKVSFEDLETEIQRLKEMNLAEEAHHAGVQDAGYRMDYEELPVTEKYGHKGREDLPDADGNIDPEVLAGDNKIVKNYNRSIVVRAARDKAIDRLQAELDGRPWDDGMHGNDTSFDFGANAEPDKATQSMSLKSAQMLKFKLDDMLEFADARGRFPDGTAATNERLRAVNETRNQLLAILNKHSPDFAKGNEVWAGESVVQAAGKQGLRFLEPNGFSDLQANYPNLTLGEREQHNTSALSGPIRNRIFTGNAIDRAKMLNSPDMQERLQVVVPPERMPAFRRNIDWEHQIALTNQQIPNGSDTYSNFANDADMSGGVPGGLLKMLLSGHPSAAAKGLATKLLDSRLVARANGITEARADALAPRLQAGMVAREDLVKMLEDLANQYELMRRMYQAPPAVSGATAASGVRALGPGQP